MDGIKGGNQSKNADPDSSAMIRRRKEPRHAVDTSAAIRLIDLGAIVEGRILDLSMGGCRIQTSRRFPVGLFRRVEAQFRIHGLPFRLAGVTQAIYDPFNVGIRFLDMTERKREQLAQLIDEIKAAKESNGQYDSSAFEWE